MCTVSKIPGCGCEKLKKKKEYLKQGISWDKCGDNIEFGEKNSRRFTDRLEKGNAALRAVNLHNNEVGREVTKVSYGYIRSLPLGEG